MKVNPRCAGVDRQGQQCGRRVKDGSQPPLCHLHKPGAGPPGTPFVPLTPFDPIAKLTKIARNDRHAQQLQAIKMLRDIASDPKPPDASWTTELTPEERALLSASLKTYRLLRARAESGGVGHGSPMPGCACALCEPLPTDPPHPVPEPVAAQDPPTSVTASASRPETERQDAEPYELPRERWDEVGLFKDNGVITHSLGDEHAQKILSGDISYEEAREQQCRARRAADVIAASHQDSRLR